ncbi:MAG: ubiquinone/menaquinone biosynthesis C-methylase UbiE [Verrucomicrobiales bacterium]
MKFPYATEQAQAWIREHVQPGDTVIDATAGNGHDTEFLARLVGADGRVLAFDIQSEALESTRTRLESEGLEERVTLILAGHETMAEHASQASTVMFNLGYLPGSDRARITKAKTTLTAIESAQQLLEPGGLITIVAYPTHEGGQAETEAVLAHCQGLGADFRAIRYDPLNPKGTAVTLFAICRPGGSGPE